MPEPTVNVNVGADNITVITAPPGLFSFIRVWGYELIPDGSTSLSLQDTAGTVYVGPMSVDIGGGLVKNVGNGPAFDLPKGTGLVIGNSGPAQIGGSIQYQIVMA